METVERDYSPKGVQFFYIYKALAHPEQNGYVAPFTLKERLMHVAEAKKKLGSHITWLCDTMSNDLKHALGNAPNSEFLIDPKGKILVARQWSSPKDLREDLAKLVGRVDPPTTIESLGMKPMTPAKQVAKGIVPRVKLPGPMTPLQVLPHVDDSRMPFYAKLRVEAEPAFLSEGKGKLYLGFFLDPLYRVHWNNRSPEMHFELQAPSGVSITPSEGKGPTVDADADADPREFLADISGQSDEPIQLTVHYFACDDAQTFCAPVTQHYDIKLQPDRDGGARRGVSGRRNGAMAGRGGRFNPPFGNRPPDNPFYRLLDTDGDGVLSNAELSGTPKRLLTLDRNQDGQLSREELRSVLQRFPMRSPSGPSTDLSRRFRELDRNGDGNLTKDELPEFMRQRWNMMDINGDDVVDPDEQSATLRRIEGRRNVPRR